MVTEVEEVWRGRLTVASPFNFRTTMRKPSHFPTPLEAFVEDRLYAVVVEVDGRVFGCEVSDAGLSRVDLALFADCGVDAPESLVAEVARRLGLTVDLSGFESIWDTDPLLSSLDRDLLGGRPAMPHSLYDFLMICVFLQNTQISRTVRMMQTMLDHFGTTVRFPCGRTLPAMWPASRLAGVSEEHLRALKLGYRARTIDRLSDQFAAEPSLEGELLLVSGTDQLRRRLLDLYGVGPATSGYLSFEWFKNCDDFVHVSPWEAKILGRLLFEDEVPADRVISEAHARWEPYTMLAVHALFESVFWMRATGFGPAWLEPLIRL